MPAFSACPPRCSRSSSSSPGVDSSGPRTPAPTPGGATIVDVRGDRDTGFAIVHYDGRVDHPPTLSRAGPSAGVRGASSACAAGPRCGSGTARLGRLKRALEYAHSLR